jgi:hypothetical protein
MHRLGRAEEAAKTQLKFSAECICFPEREQPFFNWPSEERIAAEVKCPLHGERFRPMTFFVYVSKWHREKQPRLLQTHHSEQYRKAWFAGFPPDLWPAHEILSSGGIALELKDGTAVQTE